jgi:hypothetical protein
MGGRYPERSLRLTGLLFRAAWFLVCQLLGSNRTERSPTNLPLPYNPDGDHGHCFGGECCQLLGSLFRGSQFPRESLDYRCGPGRCIRHHEPGTRPPYQQTPQTRPRSYPRNYLLQGEVAALFGLLNNWHSAALGVRSVPSLDSGCVSVLPIYTPCP